MVVAVAAVLEVAAAEEAAAVETGTEVISNHLAATAKPTITTAELTTGSVARLNQRAKRAVAAVAEDLKMANNLFWRALLRRLLFQKTDGSLVRIRILWLLLRRQ